jgi:ubiquinone/menaquinone biosynthesis C-methylase UbiE
MGESPYKETTRSPRPISFEDYGGSAPENYERYFVPVIGTPLATDLVDVAVLRPGERVLDVACGTGVVARLAAGRVEVTGTVAGLDINPGMLSVARLVTPAGSPVKWYESSVEEMPLPDEAFDVVLCSLGMQFFPDRLAALREMRRVLAPGGRLVFNVPGPTPRAFVVLAKALSRHIDPGLAAFVNRVFSLYDPDELQQLMGDAGFRKGAAHSDTRTLRLPAPEEFLWQYVHSTPLVDAVVQADEKSRAALERDVIAGWQVFVEEGALLLQLDVTVATSQK